MNFATAIAILLASCRFLGGQLLGLVAVKKMGRYLALLLLIAIPILILRLALVSIGVPSFIIVCFASAAYLGAFYFLERKDLRSLLSRINRLK